MQAREMPRQTEQPRFGNAEASLFVPREDDGSCWTRTTHLGIGAHQDDLEFMALHGILECLHSGNPGFGGVTCTNGAGSARTGKYAGYTDEMMVEVRRREQDEAARLGSYSFMAQLGYGSGEIKSAEGRRLATRDIQEVLRRSKPKVVYTHNPADKHDTQRGVF